MRWLLLLTLLALTADADDRAGRFDRFCRQRSDRGLPCDGYAFFEAFPASGAGTTTACSTTAPTGAKGEVLTGFTRAGSAWCTKDDYSLVLLAANQLRVMSGTGGTTPLGAFAEPAALNSFLNNRDLSQASTTKTGMTCAKTATGVDNVANSASTCTASGANGTALQALVIVAATRNSSLYIKRRTGTGGVDVTRDNGATWTAVTSSLSGSIFKRVVSREAIGCAFGGCIVVPAMTSGAANPTIGIRLATSGDAVDVDLVQDETTDAPSSPITTAGAATPRAADGTPTFPTASFTPLSISYTVLITSTTGGSTVEHFNSGTAFYLSNTQTWTADLGTSSQCYAYSGSGSAGTTSIYTPPLGPTPVSCSLAPGSTITTNVLGLSTPIATTATAQAFTGVRIGNGAYGSGGMLISQVCSDPVAGRCTLKQTHPTAVAWVGDSITRGDAASPSRPPAVLRTLLPSRTIYNLGINGQTVSGCATGVSGAIAARAGTLVILCGVNDLAGGVSAATIWTTLGASLSAAKAAGMKVIPVLPTPWAAAASWSAPKQTETDALKALLVAWCSANSSTCVNTDSMGTGSPLQLSAANNSGDGLHPNATGGAALAALVNSATP